MRDADSCAHTKTVFSDPTCKVARQHIWCSNKAALVRAGWPFNLPGVALEYVGAIRRSRPELTQHHGSIVAPCTLRWLRLVLHELAVLDEHVPAGQRHHMWLNKCAENITQKRNIAKSRASGTSTLTWGEKPAEDNLMLCCVLRSQLLTILPRAPHWARCNQLITAAVECFCEPAHT